MKVLLDTHTFLWFVAGDPKMSAAAVTVVEDPANDSFLSIATPWEIAIKASSGKLALAEQFAVMIPREIAASGFAMVPTTLAHIADIIALPLHHRDPFDRLIVAQSLHEHMPLVSADATLDDYGIRRIW